MKKEKREKTSRIMKLCFMTVLMWVFACGLALAQQGFGTPLESQNQGFDDYDFSETLPAESFFNEMGNPYLRDEGDDGDEWDEDNQGSLDGNGTTNADGVGVPVGNGVLILLLSSVSYAGTIFIRKYKKINNKFLM